MSSKEVVVALLPPVGLKVIKLQAVVAQSCARTVEACLLWTVSFEATVLLATVARWPPAQSTTAQLPTSSKTSSPKTRPCICKKPQQVARQSSSPPNSTTTRNSPMRTTKAQRKITPPKRCSSSRLRQEARSARTAEFTCSKATCSSRTKR